MINSTSKEVLQPKIGPNTSDRVNDGAPNKALFVYNRGFILHTKVFVSERKHLSIAK